MQRFDFEVLKDNQTIMSERSIMLRDSASAWARIAKLAATVHVPGSLIRVKDQSGDTVILVGVASARRFLNLVAA
jgi:hypothetical protein